MLTDDSALLGDTYFLLDCLIIFYLTLLTSFSIFSLTGVLGLLFDTDLSGGPLASFFGDFESFLKDFLFLLLSEADADSDFDYSEPVLDLFVSPVTSLVIILSKKIFGAGNYNKSESSF